jgi:serine protease inhibitor
MQTRLDLCLVLAAVVSACGGNAQEPPGAQASAAEVIAARQLPADVAEDAKAVVTANNQFACDVYKKLGATAGNVFFSPFSISTALAMTDAGAAGDTDTELRAALHFTLPGARLHAAYGALLTSLAKGRSFGAYTLATADRLFGQKGFAFVPAFLQTTRDD